MGLEAMSGTIYRQGLIRLGERYFQWGHTTTATERFMGGREMQSSMGDILNQCRNTYGYECME